MKRVLISLLALILALATLVGCTGETPSDGSSQTPPATTNPPSTDDTISNAYIVTQNYIPQDVFKQMKTYFESTEKGFYPCDDRKFAPLVSTDALALGGATIKSITIPVFSTGEADANGDFTFSIHILPSAWKALRTTMANADAPIVVKINGAEHGLEENKIAVRKFVKVDLTDYNIVLEPTQTLGFSSNTDTIIPARVLTKGTVDDLGKEKYAPAKYMIDNWDVVGYYYYNTDSEEFTYTDNSLLFDFELERTYESEAAYNAEIAAKAQEDTDYAAKLAAVKAAYGDKCFSLIGDSISTYQGVTNNSAVHPSLSLNAVHYTINTTVYDYTKTYWGKLSQDTGMDRCVINSWSGGKVYGTIYKNDDGSINQNKTEKDNMLTRSYNLTASSGKKPDVIFLYYGINDMLNSPSSVNPKNDGAFTGTLPTGDLYQRLESKPADKSDKEVVAEWFAEVQRKAAAAGYVEGNPNTIKRGQTFNTWEAAYALSLQNIKRLYSDAEVFVFTLAECNHGSSTQPRLSKANTVLTALAEYFEVGIVDQSNSEINKQNSHTYARDAYGLHPNGKGHAAITKLIVETLYEKLPK